MVRYHNVLVSTSGLESKAYTISCIELDKGSSQMCNSFDWTQGSVASGGSSVTISMFGEVTLGGLFEGKLFLDFIMWALMVSLNSW